MPDSNMFHIIYDMPKPRLRSLCLWYGSDSQSIYEKLRVSKVKTIHEKWQEKPKLNRKSYFNFSFHRNCKKAGLILKIIFTANHKKISYFQKLQAVLGIVDGTEPVLFLVSVQTSNFFFIWFQIFRVSLTLSFSVEQTDCQKQNQRKTSNCQSSLMHSLICVLNSTVEISKGI